MRVYIACLLLLIAPAAIVYGIKEYRLIEQERQRFQMPAHGEVLFFNASWCGPCRKMKPIVRQMKRQGYHMRDIDVDRNRKLADEYGIRSVPTFVFVENGDEVDRFSGSTSPERLRAMCDNPAYH